MIKKFLGFMLYIIILGGCTTAQKMQQLPLDIQPEQIKDVMKKVADWQLANPSRYDTRIWPYGALFTGLTTWAQMADNDNYYQSLLEFGQKNQWQLGSRTYHADDHCVGQMYIDLYKRYKDPKMIEEIQKCFDSILVNQPTSDMKMEKEGDQDRWNWCDALFMSPPVWVKLARITGDNKYLDYMNKEWWDATDYLYDKDEHLYYRDSRYFSQREANGKKVFWSRGNGWVFAGLVRILEEIPDDYPDKLKYVQLYQRMAAKLAAIQPEGGLWHPSLLDPVTFSAPEASGSGFFLLRIGLGYQSRISG